MTTLRYSTCPQRLSDEQLQEYWEKGFIIFENALTPEEVDEAKNGLFSVLRSELSDPEVEVVRPAPSSEKHNYGGVIYRSKERGGALNNHMFTQLEPGFDPEGKSAEEIELHVRKFAWFEDSSPLFHSLYTDHPRVIGVVRSILGPEIALYQSMALVKPAHGGVEKPWHQDNAYFSVADLDQVVGTWIALDDATADNGCMHFVPGGHKSGPVKHRHTTDCEIAPERLSGRPVEAAQMRAGSIVFFHGNIPHFTPRNNSDKRRRALQYHFRSTANDLVTREQYYSIFREKDGTPASCAAATQDRI